MIIMLALSWIELVSMFHIIIFKLCRQYNNMNRRIFVLLVTLTYIDLFVCSFNVIITFVHLARFNAL